MTPQPPRLLRRTLGGTAIASLLAPSGTALAQARSPVAPVRAVPMPCANAADDIVGLVLEGSGAPAGTIVVLGQTFAPGDLPRGHVVAARLSGGRRIPTQFDVTTRHPDGSARFGILSLASPALRRGERGGVVLARAIAGDAMPALDAAAFDGRQARLVVTPTSGGEAWTADLVALARTALAAPLGRPWQSGPLAVQVRVTVPVPAAAVGGATSARLLADVALRADGSLWVDVWIRNDIAMRPGGGTALYAMQVFLDGREALSFPAVRQWQYTGLGRLLGSLAGGRAAPSPPLVRADAGYLADTGAVARYDISTGVDEALLAQIGAAAAAPDWSTPFAPRGIMQNMPTTGGRADIGPATMWQAAWLISGDPRAAAYAIGQAEAAGAVPWHFWDPSGGVDGTGGWMDTRRWPRFWTDPRGGNPPRTLLQPMPSPAESGWTPDRAHQPDLSFVPYLLTGRRCFLDGVLSQGVWSILSQWPTPRGAVGANPAVHDVNVINRSQVRSSAWSMRQLDNAGWIAPDNDASRAFLLQAAATNWAWLREQLPAWTIEQGEAHGWIRGDYGTAGALPPWQQDYFASSAAAAARRGSADARAVLMWMSNFLAGRVLSEAKGFARNDAVTYLIAITNGNATRGPPLRTWAEIGAATRARGLSNGTGWAKSMGEYGRVGLQSLAAMVDVLGTEEARRAYTLLLAAAPPNVGADVFARSPAFNITPRGLPRVASRAPRCEVTAAPGR